MAAPILGSPTALRADPRFDDRGSLMHLPASLLNDERRRRTVDIHDFVHIGPTGR
jgi:hypothetical protein